MDSDKSGKEKLVKQVTGRISTLILSALIGVPLMAAADESLTTVELAETTVFADPAGAAIEVAAGRYRVGAFGERSLRLTPEDGGEILVIGAEEIEHSETVGDLLALCEAGDPGVYHLLLVSRAGEALEAIGSLGASRSAAGSCGGCRGAGSARRWPG